MRIFFFLLFAMAVLTNLPNAVHAQDEISFVEKGQKCPTQKDRKGREVEVKPQLLWMNPDGKWVHVCAKYKIVLITSVLIKAPVKELEESIWME